MLADGGETTGVEITRPEDVQAKGTINAWPREEKLVGGLTEISYPATRSHSNIATGEREYPMGGYNRSKQQPEKEPERTEDRGKAPDFVIRARQSANSDFYLNLGAAWEIEVKGKKAFSLKFNSVPTGWDGSALMLMPKED